jgi:hypothetical protein
MSHKPEHDQDGVDRDDTTAEVHENVRHSTEGVEEKAAGTKGRPAAGLIGNGMGVDPRLTAQR